MAWCPRCGGEFVEGIKFCKKCEVDLVDSIDGGLKEKDKEIDSKKSQTPVKEIFLINTNNLVELAYITSLFEQEDISYRSIEKDIGQYLTIRQGRSYLGNSIYVEQPKYNIAKEIVDSYKATPIYENEFEAPIYEARNYNKIFAIIFWIWLFICLFCGISPG